MITDLGVFIGLNRQTQVFDYGCLTLAYAAGTTVALWDPLSANGVTHTLKHHTAPVTAVAFIGLTMVSAGEDLKVALWQDHKVVSNVDIHQKSVTVLAVADDNSFFILGATDKQMAIVSPQGEVIQVVELPFYPLSIAITKVDSDNYVVAVGGTKHQIYIYGGQIGKFTLQQQLLGHEDWVKCLSFRVGRDNEWVLALGSQDRYIRLWRLRVGDAVVDDDDSQLVLLLNKQHKFELANGVAAAFTFDALLVGHDDWISGLQWHPQRPELLSASADTALMIWAMDEELGIWVPRHRMGELSIKGALTATGLSGGFWGCLWLNDDDNERVLTSGKTGSLRMYVRPTDSDSFTAVPGVSGPIREVTSVKWSPTGDFLYATSLDQTTRLYALNGGRYREFGRPQIHGYDMICLDNLLTDGSTFVSGGDEKVLRVFQMTKLMAQMLANQCGISGVTTVDLPTTASVPVLGLSNKAGSTPTNNDANDGDDADKEGSEEAEEDVLASLQHPPLEDILQKYTLFPELEKLYGHGYEISCVAVHPTYKLIASACKSNIAKHASIRLFLGAPDYHLLPQPLSGHTLTVTSLAWNPAGTHLLATSRDRLFSLWKLRDAATAQFDLVIHNQKAHSRIIWDGAWVDDSRFVTCLRDKLVKLWHVDLPETATASLTMASPVTAVDSYQGTHFVAGLELGAISVGTISDAELVVTTNIADADTPAGRVNLVAFSPTLSAMVVAAGSADHSVRVWQL